MIIEELEKEIAFDDKLISLETLTFDQTDIITNYTNLINYRQKQKQIIKEKLYSDEKQSLAPVEQSSKVKEHLFKKLSNTEYSFYFDFNVFFDIIYTEKKIAFFRDIVDFKNLINENYEKFGLITILHFYPSVSMSNSMIDIGIFDGIIDFMKDDGLEIHAHFSNPFMGLIDVYFACKYGDELKFYENISSIKMSLSVIDSFSDDIKKSMKSFFRIKLNTIMDRGIITEEELETLLANDIVALIINNEELKKRIKQ